ncbi:MAG: 50S ribosomal protein L23 [Eubacterium sp.]
MKKLPGTKVAKVNTMNVCGRSADKAQCGYTPSWKKAIVTTEDSKKLNSSVI